ncbi:S-phase kinase-associated protein 1 [Trypanosoma grayi]|uniref:S-phase kinase-associated protein 1 n=1 Tax=Trypanosoma grayi TaxID=71804 RepID=UPI0004F400B9|nr:S-phase kinase-associated protein 1 [Trypanosoma grayi]KEG10853.1 S-phase kinase-associated protein 1 [Trypanosoma grayi]
MPDQLLVLIGSDGKRVTVSRSAATQASLVLRDLLDGREPTGNIPSGPNEENGNVVVDTTRGQVVQGSSSSRSIPVVELPFPYFTGDILQRVCAHITYRYNYQPPSKRASGVAAGINNNSSTALSGLPIRNVMREIPRPMMLPLNEYLDSFDRCFLEDWDEAITVLMVKAATLLNYEELLNLASAKLAVYLMEKSVEGLRALLGVESDFTPEEEVWLKKEYERLQDER